MEGNIGAEQEQAALQQPGQGLASSDSAGQRQGGRDEQSWGRLDQGILPLISPRLHDNWGQHIGPARLVCRQWAAELPEGCTWLRVQGKGPPGWEHRFCGLKHLTWWRPDHVAGPSWPKLRDLRLGSCGDEHLGMLRNLPDLPGLTFLSLSSIGSLGRYGNITDSGINDLTRHMANLNSLNLRCCLKITDAGINGLRNMASLTSLNLSNCSNITDAGLKDLGRMSNLTSLDLSNCSKITDAGLKDLGHMSALASLRLSECPKITSGGLRELKSISSLTFLNLSADFGTHYGPHITDAGLYELMKQLPKLSCVTRSGLYM